MARIVPHMLARIRKSYPIFRGHSSWPPLRRQHRRILRLFVRRGLLDADDAKEMGAWPHDGGLFVPSLGLTRFPGASAKIRSRQIFLPGWLGAHRRARPPRSGTAAAPRRPPTVRPGADRLPPAEANSRRADPPHAHAAGIHQPSGGADPGATAPSSPLASARGFLRPEAVTVSAAPVTPAVRDFSA